MRQFREPTWHGRLMRGPDPVRRMCVVQIWGLGDIVMTLPVVAEMRRLHPEAEILLIVRGSVQQAFAALTPAVDRVLAMPGNRAPLALLRFFLRVRQQRIQVALIGTRITWVAALLLRAVAAVPTVIGDGRFRFLYTVHRAMNPGEHRVDRMLQSLRDWSHTAPAAPRFPLVLQQAARAEAQAWLAQRGIGPAGFLAIHPGSSARRGTDKRIPAGVIRPLIEQLSAETSGLKILVLFGPDEVEHISDFGPYDDRVLAVSAMAIETTCALLAQARAFVGSDSGLGHIAAALNVPTVTLVGPTLATETRPYGRRARVLATDPAFDCQPCYGTPRYGHCPYDARCMTAIDSKDVYEAVRAALSAPDVSATVPVGKT